MNEDPPLGKAYHQQVKLPIFPVYYDLFFCDDLWLAPSVISDRYPGVTLEMSAHTTSLTSLVKHPINGTGIVALFVVNENSNIKNSIVFEASNITWMILDELSIDITLDNNRLFSYLVEEIHKELTKAYNKFCELPENPDNNDSDDLTDL
mgnify:CR=1 FL=1|tara:strand:- start:3686 stop:4135 length:450 start_codon:yes stop_codon:yes gene_type:complete